MLTLITIQKNVYNKENKTKSISGWELGEREGGYKNIATLSFTDIVIF